MGVNDAGTKWIPSISRSFSSFAILRPSIHGAPNCSNGASVPRPTEIFDPSNATSAGYSSTLRKLGRLGEGCTHGKKRGDQTKHRTSFGIGGYYTVVVGGLQDRVLRRLTGPLLSIVTLLAHHLAVPNWNVENWNCNVADFVLSSG